MKEASGELNMTVITIVAVAAVGGLFVLLVWPMIQKSVAEQTCKTYGDDYHAVKQSGSAGTIGTDGKKTVNKYICCKGTAKSGAGCIDPTN